MTIGENENVLAVPLPTAVTWPVVEVMVINKVPLVEIQYEDALPQEQHHSLVLAYL